MKIIRGTQGGRSPFEGDGGGTLWEVRPEPIYDTRLRALPAAY